VAGMDDAPALNLAGRMSMAGSRCPFTDRNAALPPAHRSSSRRTTIIEHHLIQKDPLTPPANLGTSAKSPSTISTGHAAHHRHPRCRGDADDTRTSRTGGSPGSQFRCRRPARLHRAEDVVRQRTWITCQTVCVKIVVLMMRKRHVERTDPDWRGSLLRRMRSTSPGEPHVGPGSCRRSSAATAGSRRCPCRRSGPCKFVRSSHSPAAHLRFYHAAPVRTAPRSPRPCPVGL